MAQELLMLIRFVIISDLCEYELARLKNIKENEAVMNQIFGHEVSSLCASGYGPINICMH